MYVHTYTATAAATAAAEAAAAAAARRRQCLAAAAADGKTKITMFFQISTFLRFVDFLTHVEGFLVYTSRF